MAFIREYALMSGDPFRFRLPKRLRRAFTPPRFIRKFQPGRVVSAAARFAAPIVAGAIPGVGAIAAPLAAQLVGDPDDMGFARGYGWAAGDPGPRVPKRKQASAGPKAKARRKANKRSLLAGAGQFLAQHGGQIAQTGAQVAGLFLPGLAGKALSAGAGLIPTGGPDDATGVVDFGTPALPPGVARGARGPRINPHTGLPMKRRAINPANTKALRRSFRRVQSFANLAKRVAPHLGLKLVRAHEAPRAHHGFTKRKR